MGFGLITAGFVMLFNPVIHVIDLVPDVIGFLLIVMGLTKMSFFIGRIAEARSLFFKLAIVEAIKCLMIFTVPYVSGSALVLETFVFGVVETLLFAPAVNSLFEGLSFAGLRYNGTALYEKKNICPPLSGLWRRFRKNGQTPGHQVERVTYLRDRVLFFYLFRVCATLIPELTELQLYENLGEVSALSRSLASYKPFLYIILGLLTLILGIWYLRDVSGFFRDIGKDTEFVRTLKEKYERDIAPRETFFLARRMKQALFCFTASVFTSFVMTMDHVNLLVGVISAAFLMAAAWMVGRYVRAAKAVLPIAAARGLLSLVNLVLQFNYYAEYNEDAVAFLDTAHRLYYRMAALECVEYVLAAVGTLWFMVCLLKAVKMHLAVCGIQQESAMYSKKSHDLEIYNIVGGKLLLCAALAVINYILAASYHFILVNMPLILLINSAVTILWAVYTWHTVNTINTLLYDAETDIL
ncbi:MAG: hypothetical protein ACI4V1_01310 [Eubacteriales bacterium]